MHVPGTPRVGFLKHDVPFQAAGRVWEGAVTWQFLGRTAGTAVRHDRRGRLSSVWREQVTQETGELDLTAINSRFQESSA